MIISSQRYPANFCYTLKEVLRIGLTQNSIKRSQKSNFTRSFLRRQCSFLNVDFSDRSGVASPTGFIHLRQLAKDHFPFADMLK